MRDPEIIKEEIFRIWLQIENILKRLPLPKSYEELMEQVELWLKLYELKKELEKYVR